MSIIADGGHVIRIFPLSKDWPNHVWEPTLIGINKASTFTGFCAYHDCVTFARIETQPFSIDPESLFLYAYRALCRESFVQRAKLELVDELKNGDKGFSPEAQENYQEFIQCYGYGALLGNNTMTKQKHSFEKALTCADYSDLLYCVIEFDHSPEVLCSGTSIIEVDFEGHEYHQLGNPAIDQEIVTFSLLPTERGGAAIFSSMDSGVITRSFLQSVLNIPHERMPDSMIRYASEFYENTFFSPHWWNSLDTSTKESIVARASSCTKPLDLRDPYCLREDGKRYVHWTVTNITSNI